MSDKETQQLYFERALCPRILLYHARGCHLGAPRSCRCPWLPFSSCLGDQWDAQRFRPCFLTSSYLLVTGRIRKDRCYKMDFALRDSQGGGRSGTRCFVYLLPTWASLVVQTVKNLPVMQETRVWSLDQEDPWRRKWQPTPVFLPGEFHGQRSLADYGSWDPKESDVTERLTHCQVEVAVFQLLRRGEACRHESSLCTSLSYVTTHSAYHVGRHLLGWQDGEFLNCQIPTPTAFAQLINIPGFDLWVGKIPWRRDRLTHSSILAWRIPWTL